MTGQQSVIWFIANTLVIVAVLTVGTLGAADLLTRRGRAAQKALRHSEAQRRPESAPDGGLDAAPTHSGDRSGR